MADDLVDRLADVLLRTPEYTREEMREACRNNYNAGGAALAAQVAQLVARVESLTVQIARLTGNKK